MNQSKRRLTGLLATTTLLAASGVGVYQATQSDLMSNSEWIIGVRDERPLRREVASTSNLAVAETTASSTSSAEAAFANTSDSTGNSSLETVANAWENEQAKSAPSPFAQEASQTVATDMIPVSEPTAAPAGERYSQQAKPSSAFAEFNPITLGQEPNAREQAYGNSWLDADAPESTKSQSTTNNSGQLRARSAFGDQQVTPAGRYSSSDDANTLSQPVEDSQANPFAAQPAPVPASIPTPSTQAQPIDTAPQQNNGLQRYDQLATPAELNPPLSEPTQLTQPRFANSAQQITPIQPAPQSNWNSEPPSQTNDGVFAESSPAEGTGRPGEQALEGPQKPALVMQKVAPPEIQVGKPATFLIELRNIGDRPATDVTVRDAIPQGTRVISTTPKAKTVNGELVWQLGTLSVGELRELEIELMPTTEGEIGSVANVNYSAQASVKTQCTMPQLALRLTAPRKVMIDTEQHVKIEIHNPGTGDATGVVLLENVPEELKHSAGPALEFEVGTLRANETREMELILTAEKPGLVTNLISAHADGNLQVDQELEFEVIAPALELGVVGPRVRYLERPATYTVTVGNPGTASARDIELVTKLPKGMQFVSANNLGEYDSSQHAVFWSLAELPEGESGEVEVVAMPIESGEQEIKVVGSARQGLEDETSQPVLVEGLAAINFEVIDAHDPIEVGGETTYSIRVVNQGSKAASGVQVTAILPSGMKVISAKGETAHMIQQGGVIFEPLASLATKADTVYEVRVQGVQAGDQRIVVEVDTEDIGQPIRREESTRVFSDQ